MVSRTNVFCDICGQTVANGSIGHGVLIPLLNKKLDLCDEHATDLRDLFSNILTTKSLPKKLRSFLIEEAGDTVTDTVSSVQAIRKHLCKILSLPQDSTSIGRIYDELQYRLYHIPLPDQEAEEEPDQGTGT